MIWNLLITERFANEFKQFKKNKEFCHALNQKIERLKQDPNNLGGYLSGRLHGYKSIRLMKNYRIIFRISELDNNVYLIAIDHRKKDYENF